MRTICALIVAALAAASTRAQEIRYTLSPAFDHGMLTAIDVEMVLPGESDGETAIEVPDAWGGKSELWRGIDEFRVSGSGLRATSSTSPALKMIRHAPGATLTIRYRIKQFWPGEPAAGDTNEYRPVIQPRYFHLIGWTALARPRWSLATPVSVSFKGFPADWSFASNLESPAAHGLNLVDALESVSVGGDFRVLKAGALRVAVRGSWRFSDEGFIKRLEPIIAAHHRFWGDPPSPFLVTVLPLQSPMGRMSLGGTALGDAFAFMATGNVDDRMLTRILAHEHLHSWIPRRIGMMPQQNDALDYWISEGFTDFFNYRILMRDGTWSLEEVAHAYNEVFWNYAFSPVRNASNAQLADGFWGNRAMNDLPYQRGLVFAALADDRVRRASNGKFDLDDVMLEMKRVADAAGEGPRAPVRALFVATMRSFGVDISGDIARFIERGETIALPADTWAPCGKIVTSEVAEFARGFDGYRTIANGNKLVGVDPDGPAHAAGLRDGMQLLRLDLSEGGDARVALAYRVFADGQTREISYLPAGKKRVIVQELKLRTLADDASRKACAARLGGTG